MSQQFFEEYCLSIVQIIETKQSFVMPIFSYYILIIFFFIQVAGYILSTFEVKPLNEQVIYTYATINEESTGTFLLFLTGNDGLTTLFFFLIDAMIIFYFSYVAFFTYCKIYRPQILTDGESTFKTINQVLNIFFTGYWWVFFTPLIEINSGMMVVGGNSFLNEFRMTTSYSSKPLWEILISIFGLIMTIISGVILLYCFRNYEFEEQNLLKRRFHILQVLTLFLRFILIYSYYLNITVIIPVKHIIAHFIGLSVVTDFVLNIPIQNVSISKFYIVAMVTYEISMIAASLWMFTTFLPDNEMFYFIALLTVLCSPIMIRVYEMRVHQFMQLTFQNYDKTDHHHLDLALEIMLEMYRHSNKNKSFKLQFLLYMRFHMLNCLDLNCNCHTFTINKKKQEQLKYRNKGKSDYKYGINVNLAQITQFCELQFKRAISEQCVSSNQELFEHYQLKLISFIAKYKDNSTLSYFELKRLLSRNKNVSFFFKLVSQVYAGVLQKQIEIQSQGSNKYDMSDKSSEHLVELTQSLDEKFQETSEFIKDVVKLKLNFWMQAFQGFIDEKTQKSAIEDMMLKIRQEHKKIQIKLSDLEGRYSQKFLLSHVLYQRIQEMIQCYIYNNQNKVSQSRKEIIELKKKDYFKPQIQINNYNLSQGQVVHLQIGISDHFGEILKCSNNSMLAKFFNYTLNEITGMKSINSFMPKFIAKYHDMMMVDFLQNSNKTILTQTRNVYLSDKNRFIFTASIDIRNLFGLTDNMVYYVSLLKHQNTNQFIIFDDNGFILGFSRSIFQEIFHKQIHKIDQDQFQSRDSEIQDLYDFVIQNAPIQLLCPDILDLMNKIKDVIQIIDINVANHTIINEMTLKIHVSPTFRDHVESYNLQINNKFHGIQRSQSSISQSNQQSYSSRRANVAQPSLLNKTEFLTIKETITRLQNEFLDKDIDSIQLKYKLNFTFKSLQDADMSLLQNKNMVELPRTFRYYVIEVTEIIKQAHQVTLVDTLVDKDFETQLIPKIDIQNPLDIDEHNLSSIQQDMEEIAFEMANEDMQILQVLNDQGVFPQFKIDQKIVNESVDEQQDSFNLELKILVNHPSANKVLIDKVQNEKILVHSNKRQQLKPLVFLKNQILIEDAPQFDEDEYQDIKSNNLLSPRQPQTGRLLQRPSKGDIYQNGIVLNENVFDPQLQTPNDQSSKKQKFQFKEKIQTDTKKEKSGRQSLMQSKASSLSKFQVYHMIENIYLSGRNQPRAIKKLLIVNLIQILILLAGLVTMVLVPIVMDSQILIQSQMLLSPLKLNSFYNEGYLGTINIVIDNKQILCFNRTDFEKQLASFYVQQSKINLNNMLFNETSTIIQLIHEVNSLNQKSININTIQNQIINSGRSTIFEFLTNIIQQINSVSTSTDQTQIRNSAADLLINYPIFQSFILSMFDALVNDMNLSLKSLSINMIMIPIIFIIIYVVGFALVLFYLNRVINYEQKLIIILSKLSKQEIEKIIQSLRGVLDDYNTSNNIKIIEVLQQKNNLNNEEKILQNQSNFFLYNQAEIDQNQQKQQKRKQKLYHNQASSNQKTSFRLPKNLIYMLVFGSIGIVLFISFIGFYQNYMMETQFSVNKLQDFLQAMISVDNLVFSSQMVITNKIIQNKFQNDHTQINLRILSQIYQNQSLYWQNSFQQELSQSNQFISLLSELQINFPQINNIIQENLCNSINSSSILEEQQIFTQICNSSSYLYLEKGLIQTYSSLILFYTNNYEIFSINSTSKIDVLIQQQGYQSLVQEYYALILFQLTQIISYQQDYQLNLEIQFQNNLQLFGFIMGIIFITISVVQLIIYHKLKHDQMENLKFSLTLLPQEKLEDQTIMHMLKTLAQL